MAQTTATNTDVIILINEAFASNGSPIKKGRVARQKKALEILEGDVSFYGETVNGFDAHNCLLIIAYPNRDL